MQNKIFRFNLDIKEKEFKTDFNLVQLDNTSMLVIKLFDEGNKVETTKEDRAEIAIDKNDNTFCVLPCNLYENEVNCTLDSNALASPGWTSCEVRILNEGKILTSARFKIYIRENIVNNEKIKSTTEYKALDELINEAKSMQESLRKGETVIEDVNKIKKDLTEIKESILNKSKEIDSNLAVADEKINLIKTYISKSETAIENLTMNQNKIENLSNLLMELEKIRLTLDEINNSINKANTQKVELDKSIDNAKNEKISLDDSVENSKTQNTNLKATDTEAKKTETSIKDLMSQLGKTENGVKQIIASGDLSKYVTDPKLQEALKLYATKEDLQSIDVTGKLVDYAKKTEVPTKLSQLANDKTFKTEDEIKKLINDSKKLKKEVVTSLPSSGVDDVVYLLKNKSDSNNVCTEYLWINGNWEIIGDTKVDLTDYAKKSDIKTKLSEMTSDSSHRTVTDNEKSTWNNKVDKISGKELSTNDFTNELKAELNKVTMKDTPSADFNSVSKEGVYNGSFSSNCPNGSGKYTLFVYPTDSSTQHRENYMFQIAVKDNVDSTPYFRQRRGSSSWGKWYKYSTNDYTDSDKAKITNIPASPKYTDTVTTINGKTGAITKDDIVALGIPGQDTNTTYGLASQSSNGLMSAADKKRLDNIKEQVALTEAQYNALSSTQQNDSTKIYFIKA